MKERYNELVALIIKCGIATPKKHGEYIYLFLYDECVIWLDTWNSSTWIKNGKTKQKIYLGTCWGYFECHLPQLIDWCIAHINMSSHKNKNETNIKKNSN